jgi:hypothetical protein
MIKIMSHSFLFFLHCIVTVLKRITASLLIGIYFLSGTVTSELLKLPVLADHYYDHKDEQSGTNLLSFIIDHYSKEDGTDKDAAEDCKLPFKSPESFIGFTAVYMPPPFTFHQIEKPVAVNTTIFFIQDDAFISSQYLAAIWQPPRHC